MAENISLSIFGTFGNPNGFTQSVTGDLTGIKKYDLNPTAIQLFETTKELYAIRKEIVVTDPIISFIKYSYASEQGSSRGGTFVGASVITRNGLAKISETVSVLNKLHRNLISNKSNIKDGVIMVKHSREFSAVSPTFSTSEMDPACISDIDFSEKGKNLVVFTSLDDIQQTFTKALDLLSEYDTIYFTADQEVAAYVQRKGLYELVQEVKDVKQLTEKIKAIEDAKILKQRNVLDRLLKDIAGVNSEKGIFVKKYQETLENNREIHRKNADKITEAQNQLTKYASSFDSQVIRLKQLSAKLEGRQLKQSERLRIENEIREISVAFDKEKRAFPEPARLDSFSEPGRTTSGISQKRFSDTWKDHNDDRSELKEKSNGFSPKELLLIFGFIALLGIGGYAVWYFFFKPESTSLSQDVADYSNVANESTSWDDSATVIKLIPEPTGVLSSDDTRKTVDKQFPNDKLPMPVDSVVYRIFKANPSHIGTPYFGKEKDYAKNLIMLNLNHFDENKQMIKNDNLQIPIYDEKRKETVSSSALPAATEKTESQDAEKIKNPNDNQKTTQKPSTLNNLK